MTDSPPPICAAHPQISFPHRFLTCPLCAQEQRRAAYARQKAETDALWCLRAPDNDNAPTWPPSA